MRIQKKDKKLHLKDISNQAGKPNMGHGLLLSLRDGAYLLYASPSTAIVYSTLKKNNNLESES